MPPAGKPKASAERASGYVDLNAGDHCPVCNEGLLFLIAEREGSVTLRCFACNTQGSHDPAVGHLVVTEGPRQTPTGFTLSPAQLAAKGSNDPEQAAHDATVAEAGSGTTAPAGSGQSG